MAKKKTTAEFHEDGTQNGPSSAAWEAPSPEDAALSEELPAPSPDESLSTEPGPEPAPAPVESPLIEPPAPVAVSPRMGLAPSSYEFHLAAANAPVAQPAPPVAAVANDTAMEARLRRLEEMLARAQQNMAVPQRERVTERTPTRDAPADTGPSMLGQARALIEVGRRLMPDLPPGQTPARPRGWLLWELIAELRAIACMYLDPRYRLSWWGYVIPPALLAAFLFTKFWFPFALALEKINLAWLLVVPVDLLLMYVMFKILGHEARRYRETAPDLPPSLRL